MTPQERYERDPLFRLIVDYMHQMIRKAELTPTEIREAAMLAQIHYEETNVTRRFYVSREDWDDSSIQPRGNWLDK